MSKLIVGVNTAMFDGIDPDIAFGTIRESGFRYVELAYNQGYVGHMPPELLPNRMPVKSAGCWININC